MKERTNNMWLLWGLLSFSFLLVLSALVDGGIWDTEEENEVAFGVGLILFTMSLALILTFSDDGREEPTVEVEEPTVTIESNEIYILGGFVMDGDNWDCNVFRADEAGHTLTKEELSQDDYWVVCTSGDLMVIDEVDQFTSMTKEEYLERTVN